jgi:hypothetical protein
MRWLVYVKLHEVAHRNPVFKAVHANYAWGFKWASPSLPGERTLKDRCRGLVQLCDLQSANRHQYEAMHLSNVVCSLLDGEGVMMLGVTAVVFDL